MIKWWRKTLLLAIYTTSAKDKCTLGIICIIHFSESGAKTNSTCANKRRYRRVQFIPCEIPPSDFVVFTSASMATQMGWQLHNHWDMWALFIFFICLFSVLHFKFLFPFHTSESFSKLSHSIPFDYLSIRCTKINLHGHKCTHSYGQFFSPSSRVGVEPQIQAQETFCPCGHEVWIRRSVVLPDTAFVAICRPLKCVFIKSTVTYVS